MAARFEAQQLPQLVHVGVIDGEYPALGNCVALMSTGGSATMRNGSPAVW
jgi:hypothetical protein